MKTLFPWSKGCQWKIPKMHEQLHIADNIQLFGAHRNIHTGPQEHNHIENAKRPSQRTQKRKSVFDLQIVNCLIDTYVMDLVHSKISQQQKTAYQYKDTGIISQCNESTQYAAKFTINIIHNEIANKTRITYEWNTTSQVDKDLDHNLLNTIHLLFYNNLIKEQKRCGIKIIGYTKYIWQNVIF